MSTRLIVVLLGLLMAVPASARLSHLVGGAAPSVSQTIASVSPSSASFNQGSSAGTTITALTTTMSPSSPAFSGTYALSTSLDICNGTNGANNNLVQISGSNLQVSSTGSSQAAGTYAVCLVAQQAGISNSPKGLAITLTISSVTQTIVGISPTTGSYTSGASSGTTVFAITVTMSPSTPNFSGTLALSGTAAADFSLSSTTLPSNLTTNGTTPTCSSLTPLNLNIVATQAGATGSPFTQAVTVTCNPSSGTVVLTKSFYNSAGSSTPTGVDGTFPVHTYVPLAPGTVTAGNIPVPSVSGSPVAYQLDRCARPWKDGSGNLSMAGCQGTMFLPQMTAGSTQQVTWSSQTGSIPAIGGQGTISGTVFTATAAPTTGFYMKGQTLSGTGITGSPTITSLGTGTGGTGTYNISVSETVSSPETVTALGTYASSSCTITCITSNSDLKVELTGVNNTYWNASGAPPFLLMGFNVSGGQVVSGTIRGQPGLNFTCSGFTCSGLTVVCPGGTNATASVTLPSTVTITSPGSGCNAIGSGAYTSSINTALTNGAYNSSNHCGIIRKYLDGPRADGWEIACQFTDNVGGAPWTFPGPQFRAWVEDYKNSDGSVYGIRAVGLVAEDQYQAGGTFASYTYDMQWMNGASCIRCASSGYVPFTRIQQDEIGGAYTFGSTAQMDWIPIASGVTGAALNAVVTTMTNGDAAYLKASHLIPPYNDNVTPGNLVLTATGTQNAASDMGSYNAFALIGQDCESSFGQGGDHCWLGPLPSNAVNHYLNSRLASDKGLSWLQNNRVAAAGEASCEDGIYEQATQNPVNVVSGTVFTPPPAMTDPVRLSASTVNGLDMVNGGIVCQTIANTFGNIGQEPWDYTHYPNFYRYVYIMEGDEWDLRALDANAANLNVASPTYNQNPITFGGTTYYGSAINTFSHREGAWALNILAPAVKLLPPTDISAIYYTFLLFQSDYQMMANIYTYNGSGTVPSGSGTWNGLAGVGWTANGVYQAPNEAFLNIDGSGSVPPHNIANSQFIDMYLVIDLVDEEMLFQNDSAALATVAFAQGDSYVSANASGPCTYNQISYVINIGDDAGTPNPGWDSNYHSSAPLSQRPNVYERNNNIFQTFTGQTEVEASPFQAEWPLGAFYNSVATSVNASGNTITVNDLSAVAFGSVVLDMGNSVYLSHTGLRPGDAPPTDSGAIPQYFYVSAKSASTGSGTITIACGATAGCSSSGIQSPGVNSGLVDFIGSIGGSGNSVLTVTSVSTGALAPNQYISDGRNNIPRGDYIVSQTSGTTGGAGTYTIANDSGLDGPVSSEAMHVYDQLVFSARMDYPDVADGPDGGSQLNVGTPMPSGSYTRPVNSANAGNGGEFSPSNAYLGPYPPTSTPQVSQNIGNGSNDKYVWCPDSANPNGTTGFINQPGTACTATGSRISFGANSAQTWGFWPNAACPPSSSGQSWESVSGSLTGQSRLNEEYGTAKLTNSVFGASSNTTTAISTLGPLLPDSLYTGDPGDTYWAFSKSFAPGP